ncbi:MAG: putative Ig domain-containing protein [Pirellulaceae bacterium]
MSSKKQRAFFRRRAAHRRTLSATANRRRGLSAHETLESRHLLAANVLATLDSTFTTPGTPRDLIMQVALPDADAGATAMLTITVDRATGSAFNPAVPTIHRADGSQVVAANTHNGATEAMAVVELPAGEYTLKVRGDGSTSGDFGVAVTLPGDTDADGEISNFEKLLASAAVIQANGTGNFVTTQFYMSQGIDMSQDLYDAGLDADGDGTISYTDLMAVEANSGLGTVEVDLFGDQGAPVFSDVRLANDTGTSAIDRITTDVTVTGTLTDESNITSLTGSLDNKAAVELAGSLSSILSGDTLTLNLATLETINGGTLSDGPHTLRLNATDEFGNATANPAVLSFTFIRNNTAPVLSAIPDQNATEDTAFSLSLPAFFANNDVGDVITYAATFGGATWLSVNSSTGAISGTPTNENVGSVTVNATATDSQGATATDTFTITVANVNDAPVVGPIADSTATEDQPFSLTVTAADVDAGDSITLAAAWATGITADGQPIDGQPLPAWLTFNPTTRTFTGTPANNDVGELMIVVTATDQSNATGGDLFVLTIENTPDAPVVANDVPNQSADQGFPFQLNLSNTFSDVDPGDVLTLSVTQVNGSAIPAWLTFNATTNVLSGTPANEDVGTLELKVVATDRDNLTAEDTFFLNVGNTPDPPFVVTEIPDSNATEDTPFSLNVANNFNDPDVGDSLTFTATLQGGGALPSWLSLNPTTGQFSGTPGNDDVGTLTIAVRASDTTTPDPLFVDDSFVLTVNNANDAPTFTGTIADQTIDEESPFSLNVSSFFSDIDPGDSLTFSATLAAGGALPAWLSINPTTGVLSGTPDDPDIGTINVIVRARDAANALASSNSFAITVNNVPEPPVATDIGAQSANEDSPFTLNLANFFSDPDPGDVLTFGATLVGGGALPAWLTLNPTTGVLSGTPDNGDVGAIDIHATAQDILAASASDDFTLTVVNVNDAPTVANPIADQNVLQDDPFTLNVTGTFADIDVGDTITYSAALSNGDPLPGWLNFNAGTRTFSGTPGNDDVGTVTIRVTGTDNANALATEDFDLTVGNVNDPPEINDQSFQVADDAANGTVVGNVLATDPDVGDTLTYQITAGNASDAFAINSTNGQLTVNDANQLILDAVFNLTVQVTDNGTPQMVDMATVTVTVTNGNHAPEVTAIDDKDANENSLFTYDITSFFSDSDPGDTLTYTAALAGGGALPTWLNFNGTTGVFSGTPRDGDEGAIDITVTATDPGSLTAEDTFTLTVNNTNDAPQLIGLIPDATATEGEFFSTNTGIFFQDPNPTDVLTFAATLVGGGALPAWLNFNTSNAIFTGTPGASDVGVLSIRVTASDAFLSINDDFTLTVVGGSHDPVAVDDNVSSFDDEILTIPFADLLDNDTDADAGDTLTISAVENTSQRGAAVAIDGTDITYDSTAVAELYSLRPGEELTDTFSYTVTDGTGTDTGTVTVTVQGVDVITFTYELTDTNGNVITQVTTGGTFQIRASVTDTSSVITGVASAYQRVAFNSGQATVTAVDVTLPSAAVVVERIATDGNSFTAGALHFSSDRTAGPFPLYTTTFTAGATPGTVTFTPGQSENGALEATLTFGAENNLPDEQIHYGTLSIPIVAPSVAAVSFTNPSNPLDVNGDNLVTPLDAMLVINDMDEHGSRVLDATASSTGSSTGIQPVSLTSKPPRYIDANGDMRVTPLDVLLIINELDRQAAARATSSPTTNVMAPLAVSIEATSLVADADLSTATSSAPTAPVTPPTTRGSTETTIHMHTIPKGVSMVRTASAVVGEANGVGGWRGDRVARSVRSSRAVEEERTTDTAIMELFGERM